MTQNIIRCAVELSEGVKHSRLGQLFGTGDKDAHRIEITVTQDGSAGTMDSASAYFINADRETLPITGDYVTVSGNTIALTLPQACYAKEGYFALVVKAHADGGTTTIFWGDGVVTETSTDTVIDVGNVIPTLADLLAQMDAMRTGTAAATSAADAANTAAASATSATSAASAAASAANTAAERANVAATSCEDIAMGVVPVTSVCGKTGAVQLDTLDIAGDSGYDDLSAEFGEIFNNIYRTNFDLRIKAIRTGEITIDDQTMSVTLENALLSEDTFYVFSFEDGTQENLRAELVFESDDGSATISTAIAPESAVRFKCALILCSESNIANTGALVPK